MSSNRSDSDTDCDLNPLEEVEDVSNHNIAGESQPAAKVPRDSDDGNTSLLWDVFEKIPEQRGMASCRLCRRKLSFRTTSSNLKKHLTHMHALEIDAGLLPSRLFSKPKSSGDSEKANKKAEENDLTYPEPSVRRPNRSKSIAWKYFSVVCRARRRARCNLCAKVYSYATTVTNLLTHVERCHNHVHLEEKLKQSESALWAYFKCVDARLQLASCLLCKKRVDYSDDCRELQRHLARKHPHLDLEESAGKTYMVTDSGDLFEIDVNKSEPGAAETDNEENEPYDADYLDDTTYDEPEERTQLKTTRNTPKVQMLSHKQQSENLELAKPKEEQEISKAVPEDSIDIFGKYIVSLLKKMPKNTSDKLQYQILKQIFEVQSEEATIEKDNNVTSNSEQSPVTITHD